MKDKDWQCNCCGAPMKHGWYPVKCDEPIRGQCIDCGYCVEHCKCESGRLRVGGIIYDN